MPGLKVKAPQGPSLAVNKKRNVAMVEAFLVNQIGQNTSLTLMIVNLNYVPKLLWFPCLPNGRTGDGVYEIIWEQQEMSASSFLLSLHIAANEFSLVGVSIYYY